MAVSDYYHHRSGPDYIIPTKEFRTWKRDGATRIEFNSDCQKSPKPISIPTAFKECVNKYQDLLAFHLERDGVVTEMTFGQFYAQVRIVAKAFIKLGLKRFHSTCILGCNSPEWVIAEMAAIFAGGLATGIYRTNFPEACKYVLNDSGANICLVDTDEQLKKILQVREELPQLKVIIQWLGKPEVEGILSWEELISIGNDVPEVVLEERMRAIAINQPCVIAYTSGTTANPKGVLLNHDNLFYASWQCSKQRFGASSVDKVVSFLPFNHVAGLVADICPCIFWGQAMHFAKPDAMKGSLFDTLVQAQPTFFLGVPRIYEKIYSRLKSYENEMSLMQRVIFSWAKSVGLKHSQNRMKSLDSESFMYKIAKALVFEDLHKKLGFSKVKTMASGSAPIESEVLEYLHSLSIFVVESYGLSETTGPVTVNGFTGYRSGSTGKIMQYIKCKILDTDQLGNGEICFIGRQLIMGYLNKEEETRKTIDDDCWLHTGDIGRLDADGFLYITGRKKEILITSGGENITPLPIEDNVKHQLHIISNVMVVADKRRFVSALLTLKTELDSDGNVTDKLAEDVKLWMKERGSYVVTVTEVLENITDAIRLGIQSGIDRANTFAVSNAAKIQKWIILPQDLSMATRELSPTMKLCRHIVAEKYKHLIDSLYEDSL